MSNIDVLILIPAIPALPIMVTWYLPWERWIPWAKLPKLALGPYMLYLAFVNWHFDGYILADIIFVVAGTVVLIMGALEVVDLQDDQTTRS